MYPRSPSDSGSSEERQSLIDALKLRRPLQETTSSRSPESGRPNRSNFNQTPTNTRYGRNPSPSKRRTMSDYCRKPGAVENTNSNTTPISYEKKYKNASEEIQKLQVIVDVLNTRVHKVVQSKKESDSQISDLNNRLYEEQQHSRRLAAENQRLKAALAAGGGRMTFDDSVSSRTDTASINGAYARISSIEKNCEGAKEALENLTKCFNSSIADHEEKIRYLDSHIKNLNSNMDNQSLNNLNDSVTSLASNYSMNSNLSYYNSPSSNNNSPSSNNNSPSSNNNSPSSNNGSPQSKEFRLQIIDLKKKINDKNSLINELTNKLRKKEKQNQMLNQQLIELQNSFDFLKDSYENKEKQMHLYLNEMKNKFSELQTDDKSELLKILKENQGLHRKVRELTEKNIALSQNLKKMAALKDETNENDSREPQSMTFPMSIKYNFNGDKEKHHSEKNNDGESNEKNNNENDDVSCFVE
ncbi:hypothetical protein TRFO_21012 [Tritrichomonas foetus]|uniref:Uncharacterized protein n=1 Tax=Tritrichomonas foetus TaxID=1144522 RepID=A0A1J4KG61_9EUKA|nr:hypothetical protein TRFO_21012 [Tritrichomonas foetus]|eukprot:OHT09928.1 hypothetical protein TRFO_21012 [Tritrichomonas foetus]